MAVPTLPCPVCGYSDEPGVRMNAKQQLVFWLAVAAVLVVSVALAWSLKIASGRASVATEQERERLFRRVTTLEAQLETERRRTASVEEDNTRLLKVIETTAAHRAAAKPTWQPTTHASVEARMKSGHEHIDAGNSAAALREYLWCLDTGFPLLNNSGAAAVAAIVKLGETYAPAIEALRERQEKAAQRILEGDNVLEDALEFERLNRALNQELRTLALYDTLPRGDPRRKEMGRVVFEALVGARRYPDALEAMPLETMRQQIRSSSPSPDASGTEAQRAARLEAQRAAKAKIAALDPAPPETETQTTARLAAQELARERAGYAMRNAVIQPTSRNIEVLAGAGKIDAARELLGKLLEFDKSEATQALVRKHLERAGRPELLK
jgi:hypothetical protein